MAKYEVIGGGSVRLPYAGSGPSFPPSCIVCGEPNVEARFWEGHFPKMFPVSAGYEFIRPVVSLAPPYCETHGKEFDRLQPASPKQPAEDLRQPCIPRLYGFSVDLWVTRELARDQTPGDFHMKLSFHFDNRPYAREFALENIEYLIDGVRAQLDLNAAWWSDDQELQRLDIGGFRQGIIQLGELGDPRALPMLAHAARSSAGRSADVREHLSQALARLGEPALDVLLDLLEDEHPQTRLMAIEGIALSEDESAAEALMRHSRGDENRAVRSACGNALAKRLSEAPEPTLEELLELVEQPATRDLALKKLGQSEDPRALDALVALLRQHRTRAGSASVLVEQLRRIERPPLNVLLGLLEDVPGRHPLMAELAVAFLGNRDESEATAALLSHLREDSNRRVRAACENVLRRRLEEEDVRTVFGEAAQSDPSWRVRRSLRRALREQEKQTS